MGNQRSHEPTSITNENFNFKTNNENNKSRHTSKEDINKKLQSPVESHFALTPTTNSESSSPKNGFTSIEGTNLLQEELDQLILNQEEGNKEDCKSIPLKHSLTLDGLQSPTDENISMFVRVENDLVKSLENLDTVIESEKSKSEEITAEVSQTKKSHQKVYNHIW